MILASAEPSGKIVFRAAAFFSNTSCGCREKRYRHGTVACISLNNIEIEIVSLISFVKLAGSSVERLRASDRRRIGRRASDRLVVVFSRFD